MKPPLKHRLSRLGEGVRRRRRLLDPAGGCSASRDLSELPESVIVDGEVKAGARPHSRTRKYRLVMPVGRPPDAGRALVVVLHGCQQTHLDIQAVAEIDAPALAQGAMVLYPDITSWGGMRSPRCWGWWMPAQREHGSGEVADILNLIDHIAKDHRVNPLQIHIVGLSAGAAMAVAALANYPERFASGVSVAGVAFGESARAVRLSRFMAARASPREVLVSRLRKALRNYQPPPLLIVQSSADQRVPPTSADVLEATWFAVRSPSVAQAISHRDLHGSSGTHDWRYREHRHHNQLLLGRLDVEGLPHGWFGGKTGPFAVHEGPNLGHWIIRFCLERRIERSPG